MITITDKVQCCGCNACGDICPKNSITFKSDVEGFLYPIVDESTCVDCHLCEKICPVLHVTDLKLNDLESPQCYAAQCKNLQSLFNSTSGSAFATFAELMYKQKGYVGGAVFNEDFSVTQFISSNKEDLEKLRNSKYVQSNSQGFYKQVKCLLDSGEKVLVCGLPCQMTGLKSYLRKDYDNLIIVDLICLGINSPKILRGYLDYMEAKHNSKIVYYKAKSKELGWRQLTTKLVFENGDVEYDKKDSNYFTHGFIGTHAFARPSCYDCKFKGFPRISDITIGDLWGAEKIVGKEYDHDLGTSVVIVNSRKGLAFFDLVKTFFNVQEISLDSVVKGNLPLLKSLSKPRIDRVQFYKDLDSLKFVDFANKYIQLPTNRPLGLKCTLKNILKFLYNITKASGLSFTTWCKNIYYNFLCRSVKTNITKGEFIIIHRYCVLNIAKHAHVILSGCMSFGSKRIKGSKLESRLLVEDGAKLVIKGGSIAYGADIEIFKNSTLELGKDIVFNINTNIICGDYISIGDDVCFGRDILVRDNNGGHYMSRRMYKDKRPVFIGQHAWICEQSMVMPGAKIGVGVVVSAGSVVSGKLPNFTLAKGNPAEVMDEDIYWKA
jgi:acetyltransferase-like isoleucine patch superfamily enzyme/NAD-dependent dihydropyrimidine dehydrogenase PreA subunit